MFHSRRSARHFLFSQTDAGQLTDVKPDPSGHAADLLRAAYPDILYGSAFGDHILQALESVPRFSAVVIRPDPDARQQAAQIDSGPDDGTVELAGILDELCRRQSGLWGILDSGMLAGIFPEKSAPQAFGLIRGMQANVTDATQKSITVGIAGYPTLSYAKGEILANAVKSIDHAKFFGPDSVVIFDSVSLNISADKLFEADDTPGAIEELKMALKMDRSNVNVHNSLGVCYGILGQYEAAISSFKSALALKPDEYMALYNLGLAYRFTDNRNKALDFFLKADKINCDAYEAAFQAGKLYLENGDTETAREYLERAVDHEPKSGAVYRCLGDCHAANNMPREAIASYRTAIKVNPRDAAAMSALGCLFEAQGENPEITMVFCRESVGLAPDNALFRYRLGQLFTKQNRLQEALEAFRKAQQLGHDAADDINEIEACLGKLAS